MSATVRICPRCKTNELPPGRSLCPECRRAYIREHRERAKTLPPKLCKRCGMSFRVPGASYCRDCMNAMSRERHARLHPPTPEKLAEMERKRKEQQRNEMLADAKAASGILKKMHRGRHFTAGDTLNIVRVDVPRAEAQLAEACRQRGWDMESMIGLSRILPAISMVETVPGEANTIRPVYHGKVSYMTKIREA